VGAQGVAFDVTQKCQQVLLCLHGDGAVPFLIDRPCPERTVSDMPTLGVCRGQPVHEPREFAGVRPKHEMPMIWHDAVRQQPKGHPFKCLQKDLLKGRIVCSIKEQLMSSHGTIVDVDN